MLQVPPWSSCWAVYFQASATGRKCGTKLSALSQRDELKISPCDAYPCLLRADNSECVLLLHVDDVLCLVEEDYLNKTLLPALRAEYQIFLDVVAREGDELTSLKRKHVMLGPNQLAI